LYSRSWYQQLMGPSLCFVYVQLQVVFLHLVAAPLVWTICSHGKCLGKALKRAILTLCCSLRPFIKQPTFTSVPPPTNSLRVSVRHPHFNVHITTFVGQKIRFRHHYYDCLILFFETLFRTKRNIKSLVGFAAIVFRLLVEPSSSN
jgi:hypothetical protein